MCNSARHVAHK